MHTHRAQQHIIVCPRHSLLSGQRSTALNSMLVAGWLAGLP